MSPSASAQSVALSLTSPAPGHTAGTCDRTQEHPASCLSWALGPGNRWRSGLAKAPQLNPSRRKEVTQRPEAVMTHFRAGRGT